MADRKEGWMPAERVEEFDPATHEIRWNEDYSEFQAVPLAWWDDVSYLAFQMDRDDGPGDEDEEGAADESMDGDHGSALASAGLGTDEDYGYPGDEEG